MNASTHFYSLIIKGTDRHDFLDALSVHDLTVWDSANTSTETIVRVISESDLTNGLNEWMARDAHDGPPFDDGSLLYWRELDHL